MNLGKHLRRFDILKYKKSKKGLILFSIVLCLIGICIAISNGQMGNAIRNVSDQKGAFAEYEYHLSDKVKSFVIYKEYYQYGDLLEYEIIASGEFGEHACDRDGKVKISQGIEESSAKGSWCATLDYEMGGVTTTVKNKAGEYGYTGIVPRFYLENSEKWQKIDLEQGFVFAAFHMDDGEGVMSYSCEHFQNKKIRQVYLRGHSGVILFHIVFSEKDVNALKEEYLMPSNVKELFAAKNLYIGNHVADGKLIGLLNLPIWGDCSMELQTSQEPYGIIMHYDKEPENKKEFEKAIWQDAALFLALTENAGFFEWAYPKKDGLSVEQTRYYVEDIERMLEIKDLKAYAESEENLFKLMQLVENSEWQK